ncbi:IS3 family transposase [Thermophilibacter sp. ZX-H3]|uniref:IS3 family transposase n=1 Tax=unclassified Thermophilibacter TaxID=2847308 RepID=UPI00404077BA
MYSREEREWALYVLSEVGSVCEAARVAGVSASTLCRWASSPGAALAGRKEAVYLPNGRKAELAARYEAGERAAALAAEAGVSPSAVRHWARRIREEGALALMTDDDARAAGPAPAEPPSELGALRARCEELELENAILAGTIEIPKKDPGADLSALTAAERAALAESLRPRFGLPRVLAALSLPRSTYYHRPSLAGRPDPYAALRPLVRAEFEASGGTYGAERVWAALRSGEGGPQRARGAASLDPARPVAVSEKVVRRVMREEGLSARSSSREPRAYSSYAGEEGLRSAPNLLLVDESRDLHDFSAGAPGEVMVTDITELRLPDDPRRVYLSPLVDLFDGGVVSFAVGLGPSKALVAEMLGGAAGRLRLGCVIHSDRGWHYRTPDWVAWCEANGVARSMSRRGHSPDNAAAEGFFGRLKVEFFRGRDWSGWTAEEFMGALSGYVRWYQEGRLKSFVEGGRTVYDTIAGRRGRLGLAA